MFSKRLRNKTNNNFSQVTQAKLPSCLRRQEQLPTQAVLSQPVFINTSPVLCSHLVRGVLSAGHHLRDKTLRLQCLPPGRMVELFLLSSLTLSLLLQTAGLSWDSHTHTIHPHTSHTNTHLGANLQSLAGLSRHVLQPLF